MLNYFNNTVFNVSVSTKKWFKAATIRAIKTMAQTTVPMLAAGISITEVNWKVQIGVIIGAGVCSFLTSITGIPEVQAENESEDK